MRNVRLAVIGGGITGRLFQFLIPEAIIFDWKNGPPQRMTRDHGVNYLWKPLEGIPCRSFQVVTTIDGEPATFESAARYKFKIGKQDDMYNPNWAGQFPVEMTGYDFIQLPASRIEYGHRILDINPLTRIIRFAGKEEVQYETLISTIPLYSLLSLMGIREPQGRLQHTPIYYKITERPPDAPYASDVMYVNYISNPDVAPYRFTDRFGERHYEAVIPFNGMHPRRLIPGKIMPNPHVPETLSILADEMGVKTFGRYGSWNPDELTHETWDEILQWRDLYLERKSA